MLNIVGCFFWIYWDDYVIFIPHFVTVLYHVGWFENAESFLQAWNKSQLIILHDPFNALYVAC